MAQRTYYDVLQVSPSADDAEIKAAYRSLAWQLAGATGQDELKLINEAYATLSSPQRRADYDGALAVGATVSPVPAAVPVVDAADEPVGKGPLLLRLWGMISDMVWHISRVRYVFIPFTWIIGGMLFFTALYMVDGYRLAVHPHPLQTTIKAVVQQVPAQKYISVVGSAIYDQGFSMKSDGPLDYYLLYTPGDLIFIKGPHGQSSGRFTGLLRQFDIETSSWIQQQTKGSDFRDINVLTTHYLDLNYLPRSPGWYLLGLAAALLGLAAFIVSGVMRYTVFRAQPYRGEEPVAGQLTWPMRVEAVGTFRRPDGGRWGRFHAGIPAVLAPAPDGGFTLSTWVRLRNDAEPQYCIQVPPGSLARLGVDYAGGRAQPALRVQVPGQTVFLRVDSLRDARLLRQVLEA